MGLITTLQLYVALLHRFATMRRHRLRVETHLLFPSVVEQLVRITFSDVEKTTESPKVSGIFHLK